MYKTRSPLQDLVCLKLNIHIAYQSQFPKKIWHAPNINIMKPFASIILKESNKILYQR